MTVRDRVRAVPRRSWIALLLVGAPVFYALNFGIEMINRGVGEALVQAAVNTAGWLAVMFLFTVFFRVDRKRKL